MAPLTAWEGWVRMWALQILEKEAEKKHNYNRSCNFWLPWRNLAAHSQDRIFGAATFSGYNSVFLFFPFDFLQKSFISVRKFEKSANLFCLQANNLACHSFLNAGREHKTAGSETKDLYYSQHSRLVKPHVPISPVSPGSVGMVGSRPDRHCTCRVLSYNWGTPGSGRSIFHTGAVCKPVQSLPARRNYLYYIGQEINLPPVPGS